MLLAHKISPSAFVLALMATSAISSNALPPQHLSAEKRLDDLQARNRFAGTPEVALFSLRSLDVRNPPFNAKCDWNGAKGTDDTPAFTAAAASASAIYMRTGKPVDVRIGRSCKLSSTVVFGSGVHWLGPGSIEVPLQRNGILRALNADNVSVSGITFDIASQDCGPNNATCSAISWISTPNDSLAHSHVVIHHNVIRHSNWGILVGYSSGSGSLSQVEITDNVVISPQAYMDADGIHVGGRVRDFAIRSNIISNRGDAGIAASSEVPNFVCSDGVIEDNVLLEDQVGLDNSGCTHTLWRGNFVRADTPPFGSNPAFRSITYLGMRSSSITVVGNYLHNAAGHEEYATKVDEADQSTDSRVILRGNTILGRLSLYLRGSDISVEANVFANDPSTLTIDYDGPARVATDSVFVQPNLWLGAGTILCGDNTNLITNFRILPQLAIPQPVYTGLAGKAMAYAAEGGGSSIPSADLQTLHVHQRAYSARGLKAGHCSSVVVTVLGARPSMSVSLDENHPAVAPTHSVSWAFVSGKDSVTVKTCSITAES